MELQYYNKTIAVFFFWIFKKLLHLLKNITKIKQKDKHYYNKKN